MALSLSRLQIPRGSRRARKRVGRGESSGHGKTSTRGGKGQTARSGGTIKPGFEGGQMPLYRRISKLGFASRQKVRGTNQYQVVNLSDLERFADGTTVTSELLRQHGFGRSNRVGAGFKILGGGSLTKKLQFKVEAVSNAARTRIEAIGGTIELVTPH